MAESPSSPGGQPETSLHELQTKLLQSLQAIKDKDVQLSRVADKMREFKAHIAQDKKNSNASIQQLEAKLLESNKSLQAESERNQVLEKKLAEVSQALETERAARSDSSPLPQTGVPVSEMFSIEDKPAFAVEDNGEKLNGESEEKGEDLATVMTPAPLQELEELRFHVDNLTRQNELLASELEEARSTAKGDPSTPSDSDLAASLARRTEERDESRGDNARLAKKVKELLKGQQNVQALQQALRAMEEERNSLRAEFAKAQSDWLSQEQERMESFKVMLREAEEQALAQRDKAKEELDALQCDRQTLKNKIYEEFADQLQAKTNLLSDLDSKLQQAQRRETEANSKLASVRQQLQESIEAGRRHAQMIRDLEKEKEKLLQETHAIQTSLDTKCTQLHQQVQQLQKRLKEKENLVEDVKVDSDEPLVALRAKHQLAKRETLKLLDELNEQKKKAADQQSELKLEISKYKTALAELQKFLRLDVFSVDSDIEMNTPRPVKSVELQGMEMEEEEPFAELSQGALEEHVAALIAGCDQAVSHVSGLQRMLNQDKKTAEEEENRASRVTQQTLDQLAGVKSHAASVSKCVNDLNHYYQEMGDHLSSLSARLCDEASCALGVKMIIRAALKTCGGSRGTSKKFKYAPLPKT